MKGAGHAGDLHRHRRHRRRLRATEKEKRRPIIPIPHQHAEGVRDQRSAAGSTWRRRRPANSPRSGPSRSRGSNPNPRAAGGDQLRQGRASGRPPAAIHLLPADPKHGWRCAAPAIRPARFCWPMWRRKTCASRRAPSWRFTPSARPNTAGAPGQPPRSTITPACRQRSGAGSTTTAGTKTCRSMATGRMHEQRAVGDRLSEMQIMEGGNGHTQAADIVRFIATVGAVTTKAREQSSSPRPAPRLDNGACARGAAGTIGYARPVLFCCRGNPCRPLSGC